MPASTSSNTSVELRPSLATLIRASITRESSPPDAISRTGPAGTPGFGASWKSTVRRPPGPLSGRGETATANRASGIASAARRSWTALPSAGAAAVARRAQGVRRGGQLVAAPPRARRGAASSASSAPASSSRRIRQRSACAWTASIDPPCLRFRRWTRPGAPRRLEPAGLAVQALLVAAQLARQVLGLHREGADALGQRVEVRVHAGCRLHRQRRARQQHGGARAALHVLGDRRSPRRPRGSRRAAPRGAAGAPARP